MELDTLRVMNDLLNRLGIQLPIIQAPMAGVSTPEMAAAVSNAGGLGSIGVGNVDAGAARGMIASIRERSDKPFNVNVFCHPPAARDSQVDAAWVKTLTPHFSKYNAPPPAALREIYASFLVDDAMQAMLIEERPPVVSFHFGLPAGPVIKRLQNAGVKLLATATNLREAKAIHAARIDAVVAQGFEAGGHRGAFDLGAHDECLGTLALTRLLVKEVPTPIIAAGGIMDGARIAAAMALGASAAQLGTAFILCPESIADAGYRSALSGQPARPTVMTSAISGRPARSLSNKFTAIGEAVDNRFIPAYPVAYDAGKALHAAAKKAGEFGYGAHWAGQAAALARAMPAAELMARLHRELTEAIADLGG